MEEQIASVVVLGVISWTTAFLFIRKMLPKRSFDFCNRLVSTVHATVAVTLASLSVQDWNCPVCPLASTSSPRQHCWHWSRPFLPKVWFGDGGSIVDNRVVQPLPPYKGASQRAWLQRHRSKPSSRFIFTVARMVGGPYLTYVTLSANNPFIIKAMAVGLQLVSAFWFYKIARMVKYKLTKRTTTAAASSKQVDPPTHKTPSN
ncbi:uncharacterized protein [Malus domestica]|uniref:uncharacterized protein isoform X3 n=1 Tax=Malus domestica TaxID=3750 RepID=UPI0039763F9F